MFDRIIIIILTDKREKLIPDLLLAGRSTCRDKGMTRGLPQLEVGSITLVSFL